VLVSRAILDEYLRVLSYPKFRLSEDEFKELIQEELLPYVEVIKSRKRLRLVKRDPSDDKFLECALTGKARLVISGDKDLLSIHHYGQTLIRLPVQFLAENPERRSS
jgi:uncharacterized protein